MNEKMSKRRIQIRDLQKQEIEMMQLPDEKRQKNQTKEVAMRR